MTREALDTNLLVYAELASGPEKGARSIDLILRSARDGVIPLQVLGEYLRFIQRRVPAVFGNAVRQVFIYEAAFLVPLVVCVAAVQAGAKVLLTEDMQDGRTIEGLRLINPFLAANNAAVEALLGI